MFGAIQNEVDKINNPDLNIEDTDNTELALEQEYEKLQDIKINLEDLDTDSSGDEMSDTDFNKLRDLVANGNNLVEAYRNVLPANVLSKTKNTIKAYEEELIDNIMSSDDANEYRAGLEYIINQLSTIYNGEEISFKKLKEMFDNRYN